MRTASLLLLAMLLLTLASCGSDPDASNTIRLTMPNGDQIQAELLVDEMEIQKGMMFRDSFPDNRGMLFMHVREGKYPYWMRNVKFPLDIIWLDQGHRVVEISSNTPPCPAQKGSECPTYGGNQVARYALELTAGGAERYGVRMGSVVGF